MDFWPLTILFKLCFLYGECVRLNVFLRECDAMLSSSQASVYSRVEIEVCRWFPSFRVPSQPSVYLSYKLVNVCTEMEKENANDNTNNIVTM